MKILMATHYFASHRGGIEIVAENLYKELAAVGEEVVWIASDSTPPPPNIARCRTVCLPVWNIFESKTGLPFPITKVRALRQISHELDGVDVVVLHDCLYLTNIAVFLMALLLRIPVMAIQHTIPNERGFFDILMRAATAGIVRPMLSKANQVVFISEKTRAFYSHLRFRNPPEIIFNGVDTSVFVPQRENESKSSLRAEFDLPNDQHVVLFVGRFVSKKGLPILKRLANMSGNCTWVFAGWGPLDPTSWNLSNVRVFSGLQGSSLAKLYRACDVLVLPSRNEGFPLVVQEGLASGLPVVCGADTVAADRAMTSLVTGVAVDLEDEAQTAKEFLAAIETACAVSPDSGAACRVRSAFAAARYSWHGAATSYLQIASRLIRNNASRNVELESHRVLR